MQNKEEKFKALEMDLIFNQLLNYRRSLHKIPEPSLNEVKTAQYIKNILEGLNIPHKVIARTGVVAYIEGVKDYTIAFRADMDGLPLEEKTGLDFCSINKGYMHACGHDMHMAVLLGIATYYASNKPPCNLLLIFQPAEEGKGGAQLMLDEDIFKVFIKPSLIFGLHVYPELETGKVAFCPGNAWAGSCEFEIDLIGKGGHGAEPEKSTDLAFIFSSFYTSIQSLLSRKKKSSDVAIITCGKLNGFNVPNVLAAKVSIGGTFRFMDKEMYSFLNSSIVSVLDGFKSMYDFSYLYKENSVYLPVNNNITVSERFLSLFENLEKENLKNDFQLQIAKPVMISDDISYFLDKIPGIYFFLGVKDREEIARLHTEDFNPSEKALSIGFLLYKMIIDNFEDLI